MATPTAEEDARVIGTVPSAATVQAGTLTASGSRRVKVVPACAIDSTVTGNACKSVSEPDVVQQHTRNTDLIEAYSPPVVTACDPRGSLADYQQGSPLGRRCARLSVLEPPSGVGKWFGGRERAPSVQLGAARTAARTQLNS